MLQLFYKESVKNRNKKVEDHIRNSGRHFEHFHVDSHKDEYDHLTLEPTPTWPGHPGCFCDLPDPTDPKWPKLFDNYKFIASGEEAILAIDIQALPDVPLPHLLPDAKK